MKSTLFFSCRLFVCLSLTALLLTTGTPTVRSEAGHPALIQALRDYLRADEKEDLDLTTALWDHESPRFQKGLAEGKAQEYDLVTEIKYLYDPASWKTELEGDIGIVNARYIWSAHVRRNGLLLANEVDATYFFRRTNEGWKLGFFQVHYDDANHTLDRGKLTLGRWARQGDPSLLKEAVEHFTRAGQLRPDRSIPFVYLAYAYRALGDEQACRDSLEKSLRICPNLFLSLKGLAEFHGHRQEWKEAAAVFEKALSVRKDDRGALLNLALVYLKLARADEALALCEKIKDLRTSAYPPSLEVERRIRAEILTKSNGST